MRYVALTTHVFNCKGAAYVVREGQAILVDKQGDVTIGNPEDVPEDDEPTTDRERLVALMYRLQGVLSTISSIKDSLQEVIDAQR